MNLARGLREDKVVAAFNGAAVRGRFVFLKGDANGNLELDGDGEAMHFPYIAITSSVPTPVSGSMSLSCTVYELFPSMG